jgi:hypothetical protein
VASTKAENAIGLRGEFADPGLLVQIDAERLAGAGKKFNQARRIEMT